jgi:hypothetical protein
MRARRQDARICGGCNLAHDNALTACYRVFRHARHTGTILRMMSLLEQAIQAVGEWIRSTILELLSRGTADCVAERRKQKNKKRSTRKRRADDQAQ